MDSSLPVKCPVACGIDAVDDAWSILLLRDAYAGLSRFDQFRKSLGIAPTVLTKRLKALTESGLLEKRQYSERPPREEYVLTEAGKDFLPILMMIGAWAHRHREGNLARFIDVAAGHEVVPVAIDAVTGARLGSRAVRVAAVERPKEAG